jgi:transmembrane sensor
MTRPDTDRQKAAADWLALRDQRDLTPQEEKEFRAWEASDPRNAAILREMAGAWGAFDRLKSYPRPVSAPADPDFFARRPRFRFAVPLSLAAAAVLAILLPRAYRHLRAVYPPRSAISLAPANETRSLCLPDQSQVKLNAGSEIEERFTQSERLVRLVKGEAQFAVTKNPGRPFVVEAGPIRVRAVGTAFDVRMRTDAIDVVVTEGRVRVGPAQGGGDSEPHFVSAEQRASIPIFQNSGTMSVAIQKLSPQEVAWALAWQADRFVFDATPLAAAVAQFNSRNLRQMRVVGAELGALRISGTFKMNDVDSFAQLLELGFHVSVERKQGEIILRQAQPEPP